VPTARQHPANLDVTPFYLCISRCVQRAFLCGDDQVSERNFDYRKQWLVEHSVQLVTWREQLHDMNWFMRKFNEFIARQFEAYEPHPVPKFALTAAYQSIGRYVLIHQANPEAAKPFREQIRQLVYEKDQDVDESDGPITAHAFDELHPPV
jgi:hypothetical protein